MNSPVAHIFVEVVSDYYKILEVTPSASPDEIKRAYRRLAQTYHPDKNGNDPYALSRFTEIKEAYETLTHPARKAEYLQQRWFAKSMAKPMKGAAITPIAVLQRMIELDKHVRHLDVHRMNGEGLRDYILELFTEENIRIVNSFNEPAVNNEIIISLTRSMQALSHEAIVSIQQRLQKLNGIEEKVGEKLAALAKHKRSTEYWEKRRTILVLGLALLICLLIYFLTLR